MSIHSSVNFVSKEVVSHGIFSCWLLPLHICNKYGSSVDLKLSKTANLFPRALPLQRYGNPTFLFIVFICDKRYKKCSITLYKLVRYIPLDGAAFYLNAHSVELTRKIPFVTNKGGRDIVEAVPSVASNSAIIFKSDRFSSSCRNHHGM